MTYRAVVRNGLIIVDTHGAVPDGTAVRVEIARGKRPPARTVAVGRTSKKRSAGANVALPGFGMWADRTDLGKPSEAVARLRKLTRRNRLG